MEEAEVEDGQEKVLRDGVEIKGNHLVGGERGAGRGGMLQGHSGSWPLTMRLRFHLRAKGEWGEVLKQVGSEAGKGGGAGVTVRGRHTNSPCDLRSPDSLRFVCDPRREGSRVSNLDIGSPLPQPTASRTLGSPCLGPGSSLLAGAGLGETWSHDFISLSMPRREAHSEMVSAGHRKDTEELGRRKREGVGRGEGNTHIHTPLGFASMAPSYGGVPHLNLHSLFPIALSPLPCSVLLMLVTV